MVSCECVENNERKQASVPHMSERRLSTFGISRRQVCTWIDDKEKGKGLGTAPETRGKSIDSHRVVDPCFVLG